MDADFWLQRWNQGRIGFHRGEVMPLLEKHWATLDVAAHGRVFVPLAGKSLDMHWLAAQGHRVLGAELSPLAVQAFFAEAGLEPVASTDADGVHHRAGPIDLALVGRHLAAIPAICRGGEAAAPIGLLPPRARFHWLTARRSAIIQTSPVHMGRCGGDLAATLEHLMERMVRVPKPASPA